MKITNRANLTIITKATDIEIDTVFSGRAVSASSPSRTMLRTNYGVVDLGSPAREWTWDFDSTEYAPDIYDYTPLDAELVIHGEAK